MHIRGSGRQEWRPNRQRPRHILFALIDDVDYNVARVGDLIPAYEGGKKYGLYRLSRDKKNLLWRLVAMANAKCRGKRNVCG